MEIINLLPVDVVMVDGNKTGIPVIKTFKGTQQYYNNEHFIMLSTSGEYSFLDDVKIFNMNYDSYKLPEEKPGVFYIVDEFIAAAYTHRNDLLTVFAEAYIAEGGKCYYECDYLVKYSFTDLKKE